MENGHYSKLLSEFNQDKDSIFEPCTVLAYDPKTMLARVYGINSKQYRDHVPVLFPAMYLNTGLISPPAKESTGMLFWGAANQCYMLPAYHLPLANQMENGTIKPTGSPGRIDAAFALDGVAGGEHLMRSLGGAYVFLKNLGDVELGTGKLHRVSLTEADGSFGVISERSTQDIGGYRAYNGPVMNGSQDHQLKIEVDDTIPSWLGDTNDQTLLQEILTGNASAFQEAQFSPLFELQVGNVYDGNVKTHSAVDGIDLFMRSILYQKVVGNEQSKQPVVTWDMSKAGVGHLVMEDNRYVTDMVIRPGSVNFVFTDKQASNPDDRVRTTHFGY